MAFTRQPKQQYKGYDILYEVSDNKALGGYDVIISIARAGKALRVRRHISTTDQQAYNFLVRESTNLIDFIEYQVERSTKTVMDAIKDQDWSAHEYIPEEDDVEDYSEENNQEQKTTSLSSWFDTVDTSRYLENK